MLLYEKLDGSFLIWQENFATALIELDAGSKESKKGGKRK